MASKKEQELPRGIYEKDPGSKVYWIHFTDAQRKRRREKAGSLGNARKLLATRQVETLQGKIPVQTRKRSITVSTLIDDAISYSRGQNGARSAKELSYKLEILRTEFGDKSADTIKKADIITWLTEQADEQEWSPATRNRWHAAWSLLFRVGVENEKLEKNPAAGITRMREDNQRTRYLSPKEEAALTAALEARYPMYAPIVVLSIHCGARKSELLRAVVGDFNPQSGMLRIHQQKVRNDPTFRYVPLTPLAIAAYNKLAEGKQEGTKLCTNLSMDPMGDTRYWFDPCVVEAGLVDFKWHDLRHTAASRWVSQGVPLSIVSGFLGHRTVQMTQRYAHLQPENNDRAVAAMMSFYAPLETGNATATTAATGGLAVNQKVIEVG